MIEMDRAHGLLRMTSRSSAVVEGAHAKTLKPQALHVDIGVEDVSLVTETFRLGEFVAELVDHALSVPGQVGAAFAGSGRGVDVSRHGAGRMRSAEKRALARLSDRDGRGGQVRSEEHTSELQSLMRISYDVFCLK